MFIVGDLFTAADIAIACACFNLKLVPSNAERKNLKNVTRWFYTCVNQPKLEPFFQHSKMHLLPSTLQQARPSLPAMLQPSPKMALIQRSRRTLQSTPLWYQRQSQRQRSKAAMAPKAVPSARDSGGQRRGPVPRRAGGDCRWVGPESAEADASVPETQRWIIRQRHSGRPQRDDRGLCGGNGMRRHWSMRLVTGQIRKVSKARPSRSRRRGLWCMAPFRTRRRIQCPKRGTLEKAGAPTFAHEDNVCAAATRVAMHARHAQLLPGQRFSVHSHPLVTGADCEGLARCFRDDVAKKDVPRTKEGAVDYTKTFGKPSFLTVSGQINVECFSCAMSDVYTFGPTFRAEESHTSRHLAEFWMIEPEIAFADLDDDAALAEDYLKYCVFTCSTTAGLI